MLACVCSAALLAARAGLLDGRACTTHHTLTGLLREIAPRAEVLEDRVFVDGRFRLSLLPDRGITYGIEVSSNLVTWTRVVAFTNLNNAVEFIDQESAGQSRRFYRTVSP